MTYNTFNCKIINAKQYLYNKYNIIIMESKRIIISGATSGIGCEIAKLYIADGYKAALEKGFTI